MLWTHCTHSKQLTSPPRLNKYECPNGQPKTLRRPPRNASMIEMLPMPTRRRDVISCRGTTFFERAAISEQCDGRASFGQRAGHYPARLGQGATGRRSPRATTRWQRGMFPPLLCTCLARCCPRDDANATFKRRLACSTVLPLVLRASMSVAPTTPEDAAAKASSGSGRDLARPAQHTKLQLRRS